MNYNTKIIASAGEVREGSGMCNVPIVWQHPTQRGRRSYGHPVCYRVRPSLLSGYTTFSLTSEDIISTTSCEAEKKIKILSISIRRILDRNRLLASVDRHIILLTVVVGRDSFGTCKISKAIIQSQNKP